MSLEKAYYPYDEVITAGDESGWIELSISSKNQEVPVANISCSESKFSNIAVPLTLFSDLYESGESYTEYTCKSLNETIALMRTSTHWVVTQMHEEGVASTPVIHKDMFQLLQHCNRKMKIRDNYSKNNLNKKLYKGCQYLYNLPRKLINW